MTLFFTALAASVCGQLIALMVIGTIAKRQEAKQTEVARQALMEYNAALLKERQRLVEYAKLEG
jgi:hypothetical protein